MSDGNHKKKVQIIRYGGIALLALMLIVALSMGIREAQKNSADVAIRSELSQARKQTELYVDANGRSYLNVCAGEEVNGVTTLRNMRVTVARENKFVLNVKNIEGGAKRLTCNDTVNEWALESPLHEENTYFCVDFRGRATTTLGSTLGKYDTRCEE